jgi:hypothetical protein
MVTFIKIDFTEKIYILYGISKMKENEITVKMHNNAEHVYTKSILINVTMTFYLQTQK